eukprot:CAMPEP_0175286476 /NCGR_PEP_ID=MMETSP0093-20121207/53780_1 /TAXON_ID=311494 /ORGANISM="Alexandrium monilatum, Strain CCMP3105" /LENGTH=61 /DNA_ID=CAMNT_0016581937 /DNA_START=107 /DNA_END=292 /DNA_ORIENTATION=-
MVWLRLSALASAPHRAAPHRTGVAAWPDVPYGVTCLACRSANSTGEGCSEPGMSSVKYAPR